MQSRVAAQILYPNRRTCKADLGLRIPAALLVYKPLSRRIIATHTFQRYEGIGTRTTITLNARFLDRPVEELCPPGSIRSCTVGRNGNFSASEAAGTTRDKMEELGIVVGNPGHHREILPRFYRNLRTFGPQAIAWIATFGPASAGRKTKPPRRRQLPYWVCGCPKVDMRRQAGNAVRAIYRRALSRLRRTLSACS